MTTLTLGLAIGSATAVFSFANAVLFRPFPFPEADRLAILWASKTEKVARGISGPDLSDLTEQNTVFEDVAPVFGSPGLPLSLGTAQREVAKGLYVGPSVFLLLGAHAEVGRTFLPTDADPGSEKVAILSYALWQGQFGGNRDLIGNPITINGEKYVVVGVMPRSFFFPDQTVQVWLPLPANLIPPNRAEPMVHALAKLKSGVTFERAQSDVDVVARRLSDAFPGPDRPLRLGVFPILTLVVGEYRSAFWSLLGGVTLLLFIGCANVAHLLFSRGLGRAAEISIRQAFGATRADILRQLLMESLLLGLGSGILGVAVAALAVRSIMHLGLSDIPRFGETQIDSSSLLFALAVSLLTVMFFGLTPAIRASRPDLIDSLKVGGPPHLSGRHGRLRDILMVSEVALAFVLTIGAGLLVHSFVRLARIDWGFQEDRVLVASVQLPRAYWSNASLETNLIEEVTQRLQRLPGVESVSVGASAPGLPTIWMRRLVSAGGGPPVGVRQWTIGPGYFRTLGIRIVRGREFSSGDDPLAHNVVLSESLAQQLWPGESPIGKTIDLLRLSERVPRSMLTPPEEVARLWNDSRSWERISFEVVGVVGSFRMFGLKEVEAEHSIYVDFRQKLDARSPLERFILRASGDPAALSNLVRQQIWAVDSKLTVQETVTMGEILRRQIGGLGSNGLLLVVFSSTSLLGVLLACTGIYAVLSYSTAARTHEIGVRIALGAQRHKIFAMILGRGLALTFLGLAFGFWGAVLGTRWLESYLYGVTPTDPLTFVVVSVAFLGVAAFSCYWPARRAMRTDPMVALRYE